MAKCVGIGCPLEAYRTSRFCIVHDKPGGTVAVGPDAPIITAPGGEQPMPTPGRDNVTDAVVADLRAREQKGIATYRRSLETFNGRDPLRDLYEEWLDGIQYLKQHLMERDA